MGGSGESQVLLPAAELLDFTLERQRHRRFVGRQHVLARLDEWLLGPGDTGWVVIIRRQVIDRDQPERIAAERAAQIPRPLHRGCR